MFKSKGIFVCLVLLSIALAQTDFKNTCQNESLIPKLATGLINLNPLDTYNNGANKDYYMDLTINQFDAVDVLGHAFALSGFQTTCTNSFYSLNIHKVSYENQYSRMRVVVDFRNPADQSITLWNMVSFTYLVVSRTFSGTFSDIWATVAEVENPTDNSPLGVDLIGAANQGGALAAAAADNCKTYIDPALSFFAAATGCVAATPAAADGSTTGGGAQVVHAYIMGFRFNPAAAAAHYLYAGVRTGVSPNNPNTYETLTDGTFPGAVTIRTATPFGPVVTFNNPTGALVYIKVAFVYSRFDFGRTTATPAYPAGSLLLYSSSYVYTTVGTFNTAIPIIKPAGITTTDYNQLYYHLPDARYAIYGLTDFMLPKTAASACSTILVNATLDSIDTFTVTTPNTNPTNFFFQADIFTKNIDQLCNSAGTGISSFANTLGKKSLFTIPTESQEQYILELQETTAPQLYTTFTGLSGFLAFELNAGFNGNADNIIYKIEVPFTGLTTGSPLKFEFGFVDTAETPYVAANSPALIPTQQYDIKLEVNGFMLFHVIHNVTTAGQNGFSDAAFTILNIIEKGLNIDSVTANAVITISFLRHATLNQKLWTFIRLSQYSNAYDPTTGCCPTSCPALTGLDVQNDPPVCIYCNTNAGLVYNPNNGSCTCTSGFYLDTTKTFQCFPCSALYCDVCLSTDPTKCTTCVTGATHDNVTLTCACGNGFYVNGTTCTQCPYQCANCSTPTAICIACVDAINRDSTQNCACVAGFFDTGVANCTACSQTCLTCTNSSACVTCNATIFRTLTGGVCSCMTGYYEFYHTNQTRTCELCSPECLTCTTSPALCTSCDATRNRRAGVDASGRQTCLCPPGFYSTVDGSCVQSNCNADPFCSECEQGLKLCIKCLSSKNRIIKLPESVCVCMDGYYPDTNNTCVPCKSGCGVCYSATNCSSCVALSTPVNDGSCNCPSKTYFMVSPDGVRYCAACGLNCITCVDVNTCTTCQASYTKTADNSCVCGTRRYVAATGDCLPCANGCDRCTSATNCVGCITPLLLQGRTCQVSCSNGFTAIGPVCQGCPAGCLKCTQNLICYYCADNFYMYKGNCYAVCPAGTIGNRDSGNWVCSPCNAPCKTCLNHPSFCTSCLNGQGYLQTSAVSQSCVLSCVDGTYPVGGVCQVCDFRCATCLGSATNCISCPDGQVLYSGGCWAQCPAISLQIVGQNASCTDVCPDGFYKFSVSECAPCAIECTTCDGAARNCTSCLHGSVSINGSCTVQCGENEYNFQGFCVACSQSCYGCQYTPQNCLTCATGYVKTGSICQKGCLSHQFYENAQKRCISCSPSCATCSTQNYCTSCKDSAITPRGGVCSACPYPCASCDGSGACTSCLSGFFYFQGACRTSCPYGARPINGVCQCESGIVSQGQCVTSCGTGFTSIAGSCQPCNPNCAECQGDVNHCTSCISGFLIDAQTHKCTSETKCPYGQDFSGGVCTSICDTGFNFYEGICIYGGCFNGYTPNAFGGCVRQSQTATGPACNSNQFIQNGQCVGSCASRFYPDVTSRNCMSCSSNCVNCFSSSFCIVCDTGFNMVNGNCVPATNCAANEFEYNSKCVKGCPVGTFSTGSTCTRTCTAGNYYLSQICYISCPTSFRTDQACVTSCPPGTTDNNGVCQ